VVLDADLAAVIAALAVAKAEIRAVLPDLVYKIGFDYLGFGGPASAAPCRITKLS